jgi:hypothetical protein
MVAGLVFLCLLILALSAWQAYRLEARHQETLQWLDAIGEMVSDNLDKQKGSTK